MTLRADELLRPDPLKGRNVRRLNRYPLVFVGGATLVLISAFTYTLYDRQEKAGGGSNAPTEAVGKLGKPEVLEGAPVGGLIPPNLRPPVAPAEPLPFSQAPPPAPTLNTTQLTPPPRIKTPEEVMLEQEWERYRQEQSQVEANRSKSLDSALQADSPVKINSLGGTRTASQPVQAPSAPAGSFGSAGNTYAGTSEGSASQNPSGGRIGGTSAASFGGTFNNSGYSQAGYRGSGMSAVEEDQNRQDQKRSFFERPPSNAETLAQTRHMPQTPYVVSAGTIIPAVMISGINSDLPGQIIAQVSSDVCDSATGQFLLLPQGSKLVGRYDSSVTYGQERVLVAWNRIIFPDASSLSLEGMAGADQAGYGGLNDEVNNHYWRIFGSSFLMSMFSAATQLSQPQAVNGQLISPSQVVAGSVGQQMNVAGSAVMQKNLGLAPTLTIRVGYRFNVMVNKDVVLDRPYERPSMERETEQAPRQEEVSLGPVPAGKPPVRGPRIDGWTVVSAMPDAAWVLRRDDLEPEEIRVGDENPQLGRVQKVFQATEDGIWVVQTNRGWVVGLGSGTNAGQ